MNNSNSFQPVIIIGAARSGTKLLRDLIADHPQVDKVPYDVTYIWRLGNEAVPDDELSIDLLTPKIKRRIWKRIGSFRSTAPFLVEKTVENSVRVPFVHAVYPNARFIHLIRDGRDVVESVCREWTRAPEWRYILKKASTFPITEASGFALSYAHGTLKKILARDRTKSNDPWGARYRGIADDLANKNLLEVCAIQWRSSVEKSSSAFNRLPRNQVYTLRYEDFVQRPLERLQEMAHFIHLDPTPYRDLASLGSVTSENIGKGFRRLTSEQRQLVLPHIENTLSSLGYN